MSSVFRLSEESRLYTSTERLYVFSDAFQRYMQSSLAREQSSSILHLSVGVMVHNEALNIVKLLKSISKQNHKKTAIDEIFVVSSGSTDKTDELVLGYSSQESRLSLVVQPLREGKSSAINEFLERSRNDVVILSSGDVIFSPDTVEKLTLPFFAGRNIGMSSARPVPVSVGNGFTLFVSREHWKLHSLLKRHGETIAFRKSLIGHIPNEVSADEAYVEATISQGCLKAIHVDDSPVFNKGAESIAEFLEQIRRHYVGHLFVKRRFHYVVSSMTFKGIKTVVKELLNCLGENPLRVGHLIGYVILESTGRALGFWDFYVRKMNYRIWKMASTTKNPDWQNLTEGV